MLLFFAVWSETATFWAHIADKKALWRTFFDQWIQSLIVFPSHSQVQLKTQLLSNFRSLPDWLKIFFHPKKGTLGFSTSFIHQHYFPQKREATCNPNCISPSQYLSSTAWGYEHTPAQAPGTEAVWIALLWDPLFYRNHTVQEGHSTDCKRGQQSLQPNPSCAFCDWTPYPTARGRFYSTNTEQCQASQS